MTFMRIVAALTLPVMLSGCFLLPGQFNSNLDLRKDGSFTYSYKGEVLMQAPDNAFKGLDEDPKWDPEKALCSATGKPSYDYPFGFLGGDESPASETVEQAEESNASGADLTAAEAAGEAAVAAADEDQQRPCKPAELATLKKEFDARLAKRATKKAKDAEEFAAIFGFNPSDEQQMGALAARLTKYQGWRAVTYRGAGKFDVDYQLTGKLGHDYVFPILPEGNIILPFISVRKRENGKVFVLAPAFSANGFMGTAARMKAANPFAGAGGTTNGQTKGVFTITTDGETLTNNSEDGPAPDKAGRKITWQVGPGVEKVPEALIQLKP